MFARKPGKGITLEMYISNTQVNKKKKDQKSKRTGDYKSFRCFKYYLSKMTVIRVITYMFH